MGTKLDFLTSNVLICPMSSPRNPALIYSHFLESVFELNDASKMHVAFQNRHPDFNVTVTQTQTQLDQSQLSGVSAPDDVLEKFHLAGPANVECVTIHFSSRDAECDSMMLRMFQEANGYLPNASELSD